MVIYGANIHAKFGGKFVRSTGTRTEMSRTGAFQADKKETSKDEASSSVFCISNLLVGNTMLGVLWKREFILSLSMDLLH